MKLEDLITKLNKIHNGTYFAIQWKSDLKDQMRSCFKTTVVEKRVATVCRKGIMPTHIKSVIEQKMQKGEYDTDENGKIKISMSPRAWAEDVVPNMIIKSKSSGKHLAVLYTSPNRSKVQYYLNGRPVSAEKLKDLNIMRPSYWNSAETKPYVLTVPTSSIENISQKGLV